MELNVETRDGVAIVRLPAGALDTSNAAAFKQAIEPTLDSESKVVLDLSDLEFVDSSGLGTFLSCMRKLHAKGGDLKLASMANSVRTVFELVRMHRVVDICNDPDEAIRRFA